MHLRSFTTLEVEGQVEGIALWDTVYVQCVLLYTASFGK